MKNVIESYKNVDGNQVFIYYDDYPENPRQWCNIGKFCNISRKYIPAEVCPDEIGLEFESRDRDHNALDKNKNIVEWLPVYVYDHSGTAYSTAPFSCPWDSGQAGYIIAMAEDVKAAFPSWKRISRKRRALIRKQLSAEVETWGKYVNGDVYGYVVEDENGDEIDSCSGFYNIADIKEYQPEAV